MALVAAALVRRAEDEHKMKNFFGLLMLSVLLTGCTTSITNLTSSQCPRNPSGYYRVEAAWYSGRQAVRPSLSSRWWWWAVMKPTR